MRDLDLWLVRCFIVLAEERHFGRAAHRLHISQPGLSRVIRSLEERVEAGLIVHNSRPLRFTAQGEALLLYGRRLLETQGELGERWCRTFGDWASGP